MACIPQDIIFEILLRLPVKTLIRFKCISKSWLHTIESTQFARMHLEYHIGKQEYAEKLLLRTIVCDSTKYVSFIFGFHLLEQACLIVKFKSLPAPRKPCYIAMLYECSSDGMILLNYNSYNDIDLILWNPTTRKFRSISSPCNSNSLGRDYQQICGFGFDSTMQDYKIVRIVQPTEYTYNLDVRVFTLKGNCWKKVLTGLPRRYQFRRQSTVSYNGAVHFVATKKNNRTEEVVILAFNLSTEKIVEIQPPPCTIDEHLNLKVLGGRLYAKKGNNLYMMMDNGISNSWTNIITFPPSTDVCQIWSVMPNGDILATSSFPRRRLLLYDRKKQELSEVKDSQCGGFCSIVRGSMFWEPVTYVESLISPDKFITL